MAQIQVLDLKPTPRLEPVEDESGEQVRANILMKDAPIASHIAKPRADDCE